MKYIKPYWGAVVSVIALFCYFSPWVTDHPREALGIYLLAFFWFFLVGWVVLLVNLVFMGVSLKRRDAFWKQYGISSLIIVLCYIGVWIGVVKGFFMTA